MGFFLKLYKGSNRGDPVTDGNPLPVKVMSGGGGGVSATVTGAAPDYSGNEGTSQPLSLDHDGNLRSTDPKVLAVLEDVRDDTSPVSTREVAANFETVAASQTDQVMGATGAVGDNIEALLVVPSSTTVGAISIEYGSTNITVYAGGTLGADLKPFVIPLFGIATPSGGGWEITTNGGCSVIAFGRFT